MNSTIYCNLRGNLNFTIHAIVILILIVVTVVAEH